MDLTHEGIYYYASEAYQYLVTEIPAIKKVIFNGHTILIVLVSIAILLSIVTIIRQQKIMKMLRDLTPPKAEPLKEEDTAAKETE